MVHTIRGAKQEIREILEGKMTDVTVNIRDDGPLLVQGPCVLKDQAGNVVKESDSMVALCRCGMSNTKPMCDGSHTDNFDGTLNPPD